MKIFLTPEIIAEWPEFTADNPLRVLVSGCLAGIPVGYDGSTYGSHPHIATLMAMPNVRAISFCPEHFSFGTPRSLCDIHGGDGHDVLAGRARVLTADGVDWTEGMIVAAREMLRVAETNNVCLAVFMDISAACGSQVIYGGARPSAPCIAGQGVCAALLAEHQIPVVSQRDFRTLDCVLCKLDRTRTPDPGLIDHHETEWYRSYFGSAQDANRLD